MTSISTGNELTYTKLLSTMDNLKKNEDNIALANVNIKKKFILTAFFCQGNSNLQHLGIVMIDWKQHNYISLLFVPLYSAVH